MRAAYKDYRLFALYPKSEVMSGRITFVTVAGVLVCLAFLVVVLLARIVADRRNLAEKDKQLGIINAISTTYESTFLLHLDTLEIEGINMSPSMAKIFAEHSEAHDFMDTVCRDIVSPESREAVVGLVDVRRFVIVWRAYRTWLPRYEIVEALGTRYRLSHSTAMNKAGWNRSSWRRTTYRWSSMPRSCHIKTN